MDLGLEGRVALVTGAGRGMGRRIALTFAREGAHVIVNDLFENRARNVAAEITASGGKAIGIAADVTDAASVAAMVQSARDAFGAVHILVNNVGIPAPTGVEEGAGGDSFDFRPFQDTDAASWDRTMRLITHGVLTVTNAVLPLMIEQQYGKIVSIASDAGIVGEPRMAPYSMAKAGVIGFTRALAKEVGKHRINVNCVSPGTTRGDDPIDRAGRPASPEDEAAPSLAQLRLYPMGMGYGRLGVPSDVADPVVFLCSDRAVWITGAVVRASGGYAIA